MGFTPFAFPLSVEWISPDYWSIISGQFAEKLTSIDLQLTQAIAYSYLSLAIAFPLVFELNAQSQFGVAICLSFRRYHRGGRWLRDDRTCHSLGIPRDRSWIGSLGLPTIGSTLG